MGKSANTDKRKADRTDFVPRYASGYKKSKNKLLNLEHFKGLFYDRKK